MAELTGYGVSVELPNGWDARLYSRGGPDAPRAALHAATFPLPNERGDFGSGAVEMMGGDDVLVVLLEYDRAQTSQPLFASAGAPTALDPAAFSPGALQRSRAGQAGAQAFFNANGRAFCLYAVIGRSADRDRLVAVANRVVAGIRIAAY